jgi:glyoxylase-like metal-dependent hydrolase (beta-lactamase superfamily II)
MEVKPMSFVEQLDNIYAVDAKMFGFDHYLSIYLVKGSEIALIDTGMPPQIEAVRAGIKAHGFSASDISSIFITHSHPDHCGNVAPLLRESPKAKVYIHPLGSAELIDPSIDSARRKQVLPPKMAARFGEMEPVPPSRIQNLNDGDVFDLGNGEKLKIIFAPGHQPSGIVLFEEKNQGLFINDLVGNYLADAGAHYPLNPPGSDHQQAIQSLKKLMGIPVANLYLGHYGIIRENPKQVMSNAIDKMQRLLDIGTKYMREGKPESIASKVYKTILPELEKLRPIRGEAVYQYATQEHVSAQAKLFAKYCQERLT